MMNGASVTRSEAEVASILEDFERRNDAFGLIVDDISLWRLLRFEISFILQNLGLQRPSVPTGEIVASLFGAIRQFAVAPRELDFLGATVTSALRMFDERGWHDIYFDPVIDQIAGGAKMLYADARGFAQNERHAYRKPVFSDTSVVAVSAALGRLFPARDDPAFRRLSELIEKDLKLPEFSAERIRRKFSVLKWRVRLYRLVLKGSDRAACWFQIPGSSRYFWRPTVSVSRSSKCSMESSATSIPTTLPARRLAATSEPSCCPSCSPSMAPTG